MKNVNSNAHYLVKKKKRNRQKGRKMVPTKPGETSVNKK